MKKLKVAVAYSIKNPRISVNPVVQINNPEVKVSAVVRINNIGGEVYTGDTSVIPSSEVVDQILHTKNKVLTSNITVKPIPFFETSNNEDGVTVYIGDIIDLVID